MTAPKPGQPVQQPGEGEGDTWNRLEKEYRVTCARWGVMLSTVFNSLQADDVYTLA